MYKVDNILYADDGKLLDFKEPHYALDEDHKTIQVHLYTPLIRLSRADSADRYVEVDKSKKPKEEVYGASSDI